MRPTAPVLIAALLAGGLLTACAGEPELEGRSSAGALTPTAEAPTSAPAAEPTATAAPATSAPADEAQDGPAFPADTTVDTEEPTGGPLTVVAARASRQQGYDRVVLELAGEQPGEPGWRVEYVDEPTQQGSGDDVEVQGDAVLQVIVTGVGYPFDTGQEEETDDLTPTGTEVVQEVVLGATFEGQYEAFVGLDREAPFRVFRLADPARVVIDVRHP